MKVEFHAILNLLPDGTGQLRAQEVASTQRLNRGMGGPQDPSERFREEKKLLPLVQGVA
jgi:hypothetical protein